LLEGNDEAQEGGFACPGPTDDDRSLAPLGDEIDPLQDLCFAVALPNLLEHNDIVGCGFDTLRRTLRVGGSCERRSL